MKPGEQVVPIGLKPEQVPATALVPGQKVLLVHVPAPGATESDDASAAGPRTVDGWVVKASEAAPGTGIVVVDVATSATDGPTAAAWVAAGTLRLVLAAADAR
ncbi:hypothetical protein ACWD7F_04005 [Streptomyces sp. NPDC005122]